MIRAEIVYVAERGSLLSDAIEQYPDLALDAMRDAFLRRIAPPLLDELRYVPGAVKYPFEFATARSRRAFFATNGFGRGIPTQRTGALSRSYRVFIDDGGRDEIIFSVQNPRKYYKWVKGKRQVPGHRNTGWERDERTLLFWLDAAREVLPEAARRATNTR